MKQFVSTKFMCLKFGRSNTKDLGDMKGQIFHFSVFLRGIHRQIDRQIQRRHKNGLYVASRPAQTIRDRKFSEGSLDLKSIGACHKIHEKIFQVSFDVTMTSYIGIYTITQGSLCCIVSRSRQERQKAHRRLVEIEIDRDVS